MSTNLNSFAVYIQQAKIRVDRHLENVLPPPDPRSPLCSAMRYSVLNNGKRLRPALVYALGDTLGLDLDSLHGIAMSIELIHCYSLIHDDLPAMDDDDLRRGVPTCHKAFDEATAILAGDALQALAFQILSSKLWTPFKADKQIEMIGILSEAAGCNGMVLGQAYDLAAENTALELGELSHMHALKTGALFNACVAMTLKASPTTLPTRTEQQLLRYAKHLGLAFQIQDDILDVTGDTATLGKTAGADQKQHKATYTSILGLTGAQQHLSEQMQLAFEALAEFGDRANILIELAEFVIARTS